MDQSQITDSYKSNVSKLRSWIAAEPYTAVAVTFVLGIFFGLFHKILVPLLVITLVAAGLFWILNSQQNKAVSSTGRGGDDNVKSHPVNGSSAGQEQDSTSA